MPNSDWKQVRLGDLIQVKHGYPFEGEFFSDEPSPNILLTPGNFAIGGGFKADKFKYYKSEAREDYVLTQDDLIITMTDLSKQSDTLGYPALVPQARGVRYLHNQRLGKVEILNDAQLDKKYLYYLLRTREYRSEVLAGASGSVIKHTSPERIRAFRFFLPPLPEQRAIAGMLGSLDDKIELNRRMNETLEAIARAVFRQWFMENEDVANWEVGQIKDLGEVITGKTPPTSDRENYDGEILFVTIPDMHGKMFVIETGKTLSEKGVQIQSNKTLPPYSICVSCIATPGLVSMTTKPSQTNQQINSVIPKDEKSVFYSYFALTGLLYSGLFWAELYAVRHAHFDPFA